MSDPEQNSGEKSFEATPQKLEQARKKGDIPRSTDLSAAFVIGGFLLSITTMGGFVLERLMLILQRFLSDPDRIGASALGPNARDFFADLFSQLVIGFSPAIVVPFLFAIAAFAVQRAIIFSPSKILPKMSRLSPIENAKNKFGAGGLVQFAKNLVKAVLVSCALMYFLNQSWSEFLGLSSANSRQVVGEMGKVLVSLTTIAAIIFGAIALLDLLWQRYHHGQKMRMTFQEVKDEHKQSEGDPHLKAERRAKGQQLATNRMLVDVPTADVIIVNPTHFAVALKWSKQQGSAPVCVAKGTDEIAFRIREIAMTANIPIYSDPPTARVVYNQTEIGSEIDPEHYRAVAAAIRFADKVRKKESFI